MTNTASAKFSYSGQTLFVEVADEAGEPLITLARPLWDLNSHWAANPVGEELFSTSDSFPTSVVSRALDDTVGVLKSEVVANEVSVRAEHALRELRKALASPDSELRSLNRLCGAYNGALS